MRCCKCTDTDSKSLRKHYVPETFDRNTFGAINITSQDIISLLTLTRAPPHGRVFFFRLDNAPGSYLMG